MSFLTRLTAEMETVLSERISGCVAGVRGLALTATGFPAPIGADARIETACGVVEAEVVGLRGEQTLLSVFREATGVCAGDRVTCGAGARGVPVGPQLLGRVIDGRGRPLDGRAAARLNLRYPLLADAPPAMERRAIDRPLGLGIRSIDALLTAGRGQRLGIFAGTGVGKSVLMGMICRHTQADVNVVALIGERGREVGDFLTRDLGPDGLRRSVVVVSTSDEAATLRVRAAYHATAVAEYFRDQGQDVLLMMDSVTRMAMAQRQIGLSAGEPPAAKGYPPSAFAMLPRLLERAGRTRSGSITGIYTVLVEGGDIDEPLADAVRGILDGHVWLSRSLANRGHFPAVDVLQSISRVADDVVSPEQREAARLVRRVLAVWNDIEDLVSIGAYVPGASAEYDVAVQTREELLAFLQQPRDCGCAWDETLGSLRDLAARIERAREQAGAATGRRG
jgi:flagellum-specific ATP synthase